MLDVASKYNLIDLEYFDIGGGFWGAAAEGFDTTGKPSYEDYANAILDTVLGDTFFEKTKPFIVIEPGASVVSNVFDYVTKVFQTKHIRDVDFVSVDGSVFEVKPTMHKYNPPFEVLQPDHALSGKFYDVVGSTCMEKDVILKQVNMPELQYGDYIVLRGVGSYTISLTPIFINYLAPIIEIEEDKVSIVRKRQDINDVLRLYKF
jgi:diaminopimelate decarboxylase